MKKKVIFLTALRLISTHLRVILTEGAVGMGLSVGLKRQENKSFVSYPYADIEPEWLDKNMQARN